MHIAVLINLYFGKCFCDCHSQTSPTVKTTVCHSPWSYVIALGWLKCSLLSKGCCGSQACTLCQGLRSCVVSQTAGLLMNSDLARWVLPGLLAKKTLLLIQGRVDCKRGALRSAGLTSVSVTQTDLKWSRSSDCCLGKGDGCCAWEFTIGKRWPYCSRNGSMGLCWAVMCVGPVWVSYLLHFFIHSVFPCYTTLTKRRVPLPCSPSG